MFELLAIAGGLVKDWFTGQQKIQQAQQERDLAAINNQARLLADTESNNASWEIASLKDSDRWLKRLSFSIFSFPIIYAAFDPQAVALYFHTALAALPDWYVKTYMGIIGGIWGIASLKDTIPSMVNQVREWKNPDKQ